DKAGNSTGCAPFAYLAPIEPAFSQRYPLLLKDRFDTHPEAHPVLTSAAPLPRSWPRMKRAFRQGSSHTARMSRITIVQKTLDEPTIPQNKGGQRSLRRPPLS